MKMIMKIVAISAAGCITLFAPSAASAANETAAVFPKIKVGGFARVRADWGITDPSTPTFSAPNARIEIKAAVSNDVSYAFSMDQTAGTLKLFDSFFRINYFDWFDVKLGQFKYNFSLEQITSEPDLELINKSYVVSELVYPTREIGSELSKSFKNTPLKPFVAVGGFNGSGPNSTAQNNYGAGTARLLISPSQGLTLGGSYYDAKTGAVKTDKKRHGFEAAYENRKAGPPVLFKGEYLAGLDGKTDKNGYYMTVGYYLFPAAKWSAPHFLLLARYDFFDA
ncbi:MAG: porin, partial [Endomicrobiia bacterium]|nr:porin [Endomicrobiia bacterium]